MGVHFGITFVLLITVSYINAQDYVILDEPDFNIWDKEDQRPIFLDQSEHVIHRRDVVDSDLEASGNGENDEPAVLIEEPVNNKTSSNPDNEVPPPKDTPVEEIQEKEESDNVAVLPEESPSNKTSSNPDDEAAASEDKPEDVILDKEESVKTAAVPEEPSSNNNSSNLETEAAPSEEKPVEVIPEKEESVLAVVQPEESSNYTASNLEVEASPSEDKPVEVVPEKEESVLTAVLSEESSSNNTSSNLETEAAPSEDKPVDNAQEKTQGESDKIAALPEESSHNNTASNLDSEAAPSENKPADDIQENLQEHVEIQISNFAEASPVENAEEASKANGTETEPAQPSEDKENVQSIIEPEIIANETNLPSTTVGVAQPDPVEVQPIEQVFEKVANETSAPTKTPDAVNERPVFPSLVHILANDTILQAVETTLPPKQSTVSPASKSDSPIVLDKEGSVANTSTSEVPDSGKEEQKAAPKVLPSDLAEDDPANKDKESESVHDQQSGNAVLFKVPQGEEKSQVEGSESDKVLQGMQENAKISVEPSEQPNAGESSKNVSRAGKDTTILVVLFVVVIAIGGAAFTHNYIKKRKQNASANNDLANGIRRSIQNLTSSSPKTSPDVEQGTELKPLMKDSPVITKDYTDSKKEVPA